MVSETVFTAVIDLYYLTTLHLCYRCDLRSAQLQQLNCTWGLPAAHCQVPLSALLNNDARLHPRPTSGDPVNVPMYHIVVRDLTSLYFAFYMV